MIHPHMAADLAAARRQRFESEAAAFRTAAAARRLRARPSRFTAQTSLLRRRLKPLAAPHVGATAHPSYDGTFGQPS
jgi:hypothetical protein